jgi:poly-gamma-glutamate capsule biosynthesis protein CapA/YwtB (metallophosphatase superfamily)
MKLALAGDTMLGREVSRAITEAGPESLVADEVIDAAREADLFLLNLECCISDRGEPWSEARKPFFFRAPPAAIEVLARLGVDCVTLANNHALDFGPDALLDTFEHLRAAGIAWVGAGADRERARAPAVFEAGGLRLAVLGCSDHPAECAAGVETPGIAYAHLGHGLDWLPAAIAAAEAEADAVLLTPHWGPNMAAEPTSALRRSARALRAAGAALVAGHSAHVFHAVEQGVLYDLGDFLDDYAVDPRLRNDLGLLFLVDLDRAGPASLEAVPLKLEFCHTRLAGGEESTWIGRRFRDTCRKFGTEVVEERGRFVVRWRA